MTRRKLNPINYTARTGKSKPVQSNRSAVVLVLTLLVLTVLSVITAGLSIQITQVKRRQQYQIDYQKTRYACDSALKYMLAILPAKNLKLTEREGLPDFSDLFWMTQQDYEQYIRFWLYDADPEKIQSVLKPETGIVEPTFDLPSDPVLALAEAIKIMTAQAQNEPNQWQADDPYISEEEMLRNVDPNRIEVPGPYGEPWPYVIEPIELEMGPAQVRITLEDENAKLPLGWALLKDEVAQAAFVTFCEMMRMDELTIDELKSQIELVAEEKAYQQDAQPILVKARQSAARSKQSKAKDQLRPAIANAADFSKLFHSSLLNQEVLSRPLPDTGERYESPLLYLGMWGSQRININTAPHHVLEAAFTFGGHEVEIANEIVRRRQEKPYKNIKELTDELYVYKVEIDKVEKYITTQSAFFKIRVECTSGLAHCSAVATVFKDKKNVQNLAILYSQ